MRRKAFFLAAAVFALILAGCGGGDHGPAVISVDIPSAGGVDDGDITHDPVLVKYTLITNLAEDNVFVGTVPNPLDPTNPTSDIESRGFLTFSLAQIPPGAFIHSAHVLLRINDVFVHTGPSVEILPALVSFNHLDSLTTLQIINLFDDAEISFSQVTYEVLPADIDSDLSIDVKDALLSAPGTTLQIKLFGSFGRIIIDDLQFPPLLLVDYSV